MADQSPHAGEDSRLTLGERRVRTAFNPSADALVDKIKQQSAALINLCGEIPKPAEMADHPEFFRLCALAQTHYEDAAMWAVKAATFAK